MEGRDRDRVACVVESIPIARQHRYESVMAPGAVTVW